jgi:hypothetical protein
VNKQLTVKEAVWALDTIASSPIIDKQTRESASWASAFIATLIQHSGWDSTCEALYDKASNLQLVAAPD